VLHKSVEDNDGIDGHLAVNHSETYVIGDAHVDTCENRHGFVRQWLRKFRGVSKYYLQGYLDFLGLQQNAAEDWFKMLLGDDSSR
jgi:transposase-like protein